MEFTVRTNRKQQPIARDLVWRGAPVKSASTAAADDFTSDEELECERFLESIEKARSPPLTAEEEVAFANFLVSDLARDPMYILLTEEADAAFADFVAGQSGQEEARTARASSALPRGPLRDLVWRGAPVADDGHSIREALPTPATR